jgi:hypothetical protein
LLPKKQKQNKTKVLLYDQQNVFKPKSLAQFYFKKLLISTWELSSFQNESCFQKGFAIDL